MNNEDLVIEHQFSEFLRHLGFHGKIIPEREFLQMKVSFYASWSQCMKVLMEVSDLERHEKVKAVEQMQKEILEFMFKTGNQQN